MTTYRLVLWDDMSLEEEEAQLDISYNQTSSRSVSSLQSSLHVCRLIQAEASHQRLVKRIVNGICDD